MLGGPRPARLMHGAHGWRSQKWVPWSFVQANPAMHSWVPVSVRHVKLRNAAELGHKLSKSTFRGPRGLVTLCPGPPDPLDKTCSPVEKLKQQHLQQYCPTQWWRQAWALPPKKCRLRYALTLVENQETNCAKFSNFYRFCMQSISEYLSAMSTVYNQPSMYPVTTDNALQNSPCANVNFSSFFLFSSHSGPPVPT